MGSVPLAAGAVGGIVTDVLELLGLEDLVKGGFRWIKTETWHNTIGRAWFIDMLSNFENPEQLVDESPPKAIPFTPAQIAELYYDVVRRAVELSMAAGEEIGSESIIEMISEGLSSAFESNYNAALQTIFNVWKGAQPPDASHAMQLGQRIYKADEDYVVSILAPTSASPQLIMENLTHGANMQLQNLLNNYESLLVGEYQTLNSYLSTHVRELANFVAEVISTLLFDALSFISRLESDITTSIQILLERVVTRIDDCNALEQRVLAGLLSEEDEEYQAVLLEIEADYEGLQDSFAEVQTMVSEAISDYLTEFSNQLSNIVTLIQNYIDSLESACLDVINKLQSGVDVNSLVSDLQDKILAVYEDFRAYRKCGFDYTPKSP